jgi:hypothetical protein
MTVGHRPPNLRAGDAREQLTRDFVSRTTRPRAVHTEAPDGTPHYATVSHEPWTRYPAETTVETDTLLRAEGFKRPGEEPVCYGISEAKASPSGGEAINGGTTLAEPLRLFLPARTIPMRSYVQTRTLRRGADLPTRRLCVFS